MNQGVISRRARLYDRLGGWAIAAGGIGIVVAVLGIFVFIGKETLPLFAGASVRVAAQLDLDGEALAAGFGPHGEVLVVVTGSRIEFRRTPGGEVLERTDPGLAGAAIAAADLGIDGQRLALGLTDGRLLTGTIAFEGGTEASRRADVPRLQMDPAPVLELGEPIARVAYRDDGQRRAAAVALTASGQLVVAQQERRRGVLGGGRLTTAVHPLDAGGGQVTSLTLDSGARRLVVGTAAGAFLVFDLGTAAIAPVLTETARGTPGAAVTALAFLLGDLSLVVGDSQGRVSTWFQADGAGARRFRRVHELEPHGAAVTRISSSLRDRQFVTGDAGGEVALHHATSEQTFARLRSEGQVTALGLAPKANGVVAAHRGGHLEWIEVDNPHPEVSLGTLFGKVWYESYEQPEYVWQSSGGTDEFEPKLGLVPLAFGTGKATLYAMLFALPMAVLAALYTAEFAPPFVRAAVKPTVEIMASLPSVILGFLAGLWLAPRLEHHLVGTALLLLLVPAVVLAGSWGWMRLPFRVHRHLPRPAELLAIGALTLAGAGLALHLGPRLERALFEGGIAHWLAAGSGPVYDQRNSVVVGFAMGFAVMPLIFTISEDALSSVPASLRAGSLALGASRWQTAVRVVLPMALPGVFSAAMLGFGRAIGETMIVLMATGNTPIMDWSLFTGMRTISANIAVELPEAPLGGTLYRVLFLSGLLLFVTTFAVNALAEGVRQRLREKYRRV